jgi:CIC family chloride channel protein
MDIRGNKKYIHLFHRYDPLKWSKKVFPENFLALVAIVTGLAAGLASVSLKALVYYMYKFFSEIFNFGNGFWLIVILPFAGLLGTTFIVRFFFKGSIGKGLANLLDDIKNHQSVVAFHKIYSQVITASMTVALGGSSGLEAPIVVTGGAIGSNLAMRYRFSVADRKLLLACGVAAGIAATFNAPVAGVVFALEVILIERFAVIDFIPLIIASVSGSLISKTLLDEEILFNFPLRLTFDPSNIPFYIILGVISGFLSLYYTNVSVRAERLIKGIFKKDYSKALAGGWMLASMFALFPALFGEGYNSIKALAENHPEKLYTNGIHLDSTGLLIAVGLLIFLKVIAATITIVCGGNGGNFAPTLFMGAFTGFFFSSIFNLTGLAYLPTSNFTLVGMAGVLSGVFKAPLTAIFLIAEITGGYDLILPIMTVSAISFLIARRFQKYSVVTGHL